MNSKQRRGTRVFVHEVTIHAIGSERYIDFDRKVDRAKQWLQWNTKRKNYTLGPQKFDHQTFKFRSGALASMFALKFL